MAEPDPTAAVPEPDPNPAASYGFTPSHRGGDGEPLLLLHGFTANWRTWEPLLPALEARHDVLAPTLAGHAGGPPLRPRARDQALADAVEAAMDEPAGRTPRRRQLAGRLRRLSARRPWPRPVGRRTGAGRRLGGRRRGLPGQPAVFRTLQGLVREAAPYADQIISTPEGRRRATVDYAATDEHMSDDLIKSLMLGAAACEGAAASRVRRARGLEHRRRTRHLPGALRLGDRGPDPDAARAAVRYREEWFPTAEWIELDGGGHSPQLDRPRETAELILGLTA